MAVTPADIAATLVRSAPAGGTPEFVAWTLWINDARLIIGERLGDVSQLDQAVLDYVVREAVAAKARQPDPVTKVDVKVDDASTSKTYERSVGRVEITDEWWAMLTPTTADVAGAFTINPRPRYTPSSIPWWC